MLPEPAVGQRRSLHVNTAKHGRAEWLCWCVCVCATQRGKVWERDSYASQGCSGFTPLVFSMSCVSVLLGHSPQMAQWTFLLLLCSCLFRLLHSFSKEKKPFVVSQRALIPLICTSTRLMTTPPARFWPCPTSPLGFCGLLNEGERSVSLRGKLYLCFFTGGRQQRAKRTASWRPEVLGLSAHPTGVYH